MLHLSFLEIEKIESLKIYTQKGDLILKEQHPKLENQALKIQIKDWPEGVYLIQIKTKEGILEEKWIYKLAGPKKRA